jgi:hypothetical protein
MNKYFINMDLEQAKKYYHQLIFKHHPDRGGDEELCKEITSQFREYISNFTNTIFAKAENEKYADFAESIRDALNKIIQFENLKIQVIGYWIYCFDSYNYKNQLKEIGFWFSSKHKAWIYSGAKKIRIRTNYTLDEIKNTYGCANIETEKKLKLNTCVA